MKALITCVALCVFVSLANGHFVFILPAGEGQPARVILSDSPTPDPKASAENLPIKGFATIQGNGQRSKDLLLPTLEKSTGIWSFAPSDSLGAGCASTIDYGVMNRGEGDRFLIRHHAKLVLDLAQPMAAAELKLEIVPKKVDGGLAFLVLFATKPVANLELMVYEPGEGKIKLVKTDLAGLTPTFSSPGQYAARAHSIEAVPGEYEGRRYKSVKHYSTLVVALPGK